MIDGLRIVKSAQSFKERFADRGPIGFRRRPKDAKYSPDQPRDDFGRWASGGGSSAGMAEDVISLVGAAGQGPDWEDEDWSSHESSSAEWKASLSKKESSALVAYRDKGRFKDINRYMRGESSGSPEVRSQAGHLYEALNRSEVPDGSMVYRGIDLEGDGNAAELTGKLSAGATFRDEGFTSASPSMAIVSGFVRSSEGPAIVMRMTTKGAKGAYVAEPGKEPEYLFRSGGKLTITNATAYESGLHVIDAELSHE